MRPLQSPHFNEHCPFRVQTKLVHVFFYTFSPCLPTPAHTSHPCHHHISTGRHPIISVLMFSIYDASPLLPRSENWKPKRLQDLTTLPILQRHTTHPSHHHALCSLQAMQILSLHCPCLSPICQHALDTGPKTLPLQAMWRTTGRQNGR